MMPIYLVLSLLVLLFSGWPIFYTQKRVGYRGRVFKIYKFRTMINGAETMQKEYLYLNEADGPVFKIRNDPRLTEIGQFLSHSGLDELPQFFNVLKGDMNIVGPRPLPVREEEKISKFYKTKRESVMPGILSPWVIDGYHRLAFNEWMESDIDYVTKKSFRYDLKISIKGGVFLMKLIFSEIAKL
jgi:lipopolysaccharide/colanic/teichoic acid biosynthesis glycosyltransferase